MPLAEFTWLEYRDATVAIDLQEIPVTRDDDCGFGGEGVGEEFVVIRIPTHRFR